MGASSSPAASCWCTGSSRPNSRLHPLTSSNRTANRPTDSGYYDLRNDDVIVFEPQRVEEDDFLGRLVIVVDGLDLELDEIVRVEHVLLEQEQIVGFVFVHGIGGDCSRRASDNPANRGTAL